MDDMDLYEIKVAIHAPLAGGDFQWERLNGDAWVLRSTPPSREATLGDHD